jgi:hypothetical protein
LRHTFGTRLADAGVDVVKIKELMGHSSICDNDALHSRDRSREAWSHHCLVRVSTAKAEATSQVCHKKKNGRPRDLPQVIANNGEPLRARTSDPLINSAVTSTPAGYGSYDLLTSVTGCSRQRVQLLIPINACLSVFSSQVRHNEFLDSREKLLVQHVATVSPQ